MPWSVKVAQKYDSWNNNYFVTNWLYVKCGPAYTERKADTLTQDIYFSGWMETGLLYSPLNMGRAFTCSTCQ